eukprot:619956-Prorocentrum_minimum.AAC.1
MFWAIWHKLANKRYSLKNTPLYRRSAIAPSRPPQVDHNRRAPPKSAFSRQPVYVFLKCAVTVTPMPFRTLECLHSCVFFGYQSPIG